MYTDEWCVRACVCEQELLDFWSLKICRFSFQTIISGAFQHDRFMVLGMLSEHRGSGPYAVYF